MITKAKLSDINGIMEIISLVVKEMKTYNNTQWDESYPLSKDFVSDIENGDLYVEIEEGQIKGFICINYNEPIEYDDLKWSSNEKCMVIHRMAVNPEFRNKGVASRLMEFTEELALEKGVKYLKTDTYSINTKMKGLFEKFNYKFVGEMNFLSKEKPFYCYEKML